ncbi:MAG: hypothetical protein M1840_005580 [Geoglossum simile]|nr:MAG: hypothetical protein M1840_005580 [Geoglossum simile]
MASASESCEVGNEVNDAVIAETSRLSWAACCNALGMLFVVSVGDDISGFGHLLSNHEGDPLVFSHNNSVYVLRLIGSVSAVFDGLGQCQVIRTVSNLVIRVGSKNITISKGDLSDTATLMGLKGIRWIYVDRCSECRYINLVVKAQRIEKIWIPECLGLETLREKRQVSWMHRPFISDSDYKDSRTMSLGIVSSGWGLFGSRRQILWVGSEGYANFQPDPSMYFDRDRVYLIARNTRITNKSSWVECGLGDIFEEVVDDKTLRIDIRKLNFIEIESRGMRVPDFIFGLAIPSDGSGEANTIECISETSWYRNLWKGAVNLAFPWAVYQAQKTQNSAVLLQAALRAEIALRMLNDLALEPGRPHEHQVYQTPTSDCFQVFAFTSEGPIWKIYVCFRIKDVELNEFSDESSAFEIKPIWTGDITHERDAWKLISHIHQIREWAGTEHRRFVMRHLYKWNNYYESLNTHREQETAQDLKVSEDSKVATATTQLDDLHLESKAVEDNEKRFRDEGGEQIGMTGINLKRLQGLPHPWWGMQPLYRLGHPDSETAGY